MERVTLMRHAHRDGSTRLFALVALIAAGCGGSKATTGAAPPATTPSSPKIVDPNFGKAGAEAGTEKNCGGNTGCPCDNGGQVYCGVCPATKSCGYCTLFSY